MKSRLFVCVIVLSLLTGFISSLTISKRKLIEYEVNHRKIIIHKNRVLCGLPLVELSVLYSIACDTNKPNAEIIEYMSQWIKGLEYDATMRAKAADKETARLIINKMHEARKLRRHCMKKIEGPDNTTGIGASEYGVGTPP